jgi:hypothetical protein
LPLSSPSPFSSSSLLLSLPLSSLLLSVAVVYSTAQHRTVQHSTVPHSTVQHSTAQHRVSVLVSHLGRSCSYRISHRGPVSLLSASRQSSPQNMNSPIVCVHMISLKTIYSTVQHNQTAVTARQLHNSYGCAPRFLEAFYRA